MKIVPPEEDSDLSWAKPLVDGARAAIARGEFIGLDEFGAEIRETIEKLTEPGAQSSSAARRSRRSAVSTALARTSALPVSPKRSS